MFRLPSWALTCSVTSSGTSGARHPQLMQRVFSLSSGESNTSPPHLGQARKSIVLYCPPVIQTKRSGRMRPPAQGTAAAPWESQAPMMQYASAGNECASVEMASLHR